MLDFLAVKIAAQVVRACERAFYILYRCVRTSPSLCVQYFYSNFGVIKTYYTCGDVTRPKLLFPNTLYSLHLFLEKTLKSGI